MPTDSSARICLSVLLTFLFLTEIINAQEPAPLVAVAPAAAEAPAVVGNTETVGRKDVEYRDYDNWVGSLSTRFFQPKARIYFDTGTDEKNEVDVFEDGSLTVAVNILEVQLAWFRETSDPKYSIDGDQYRTRWSFGPTAGIGIGAPANDSPDGTATATGAPVVLLNGGLHFEVALTQPEQNALKKDWTGGVTLFAEVGGTIGLSTQEDLDDFDDSAIYVGAGITVPFGTELWRFDD